MAIKISIGLALVDITRHNVKTTVKTAMSPRRIDILITQYKAVIATRAATQSKPSCEQCTVLAEKVAELGRYTVSVDAIYPDVKHTLKCFPMTR